MSKRFAAWGSAVAVIAAALIGGTASAQAATNPNASYSGSSYNYGCPPTSSGFVPLFYLYTDDLGSTAWGNADLGIGPWNIPIADTNADGTVCIRMGTGSTVYTDNHLPTY